jgi:hypothetical protein
MCLTVSPKWCMAVFVVVKTISEDELVRAEGGQNTDRQWEIV